MTLAGDSEARYQQLLDSYGREVFAYCRRRSDAETAADCAAETFLVAWRRLGDVPDGGVALGWLFGVARRVMANEFRRTRRLQRLLGRLRRVEPVSNPGPEAVVVRRESERMVLAALSRLRPEDQEVLRLALWEELPHAEIAAVVGCSTQAASQRLHRATRRVAQEYERLDHGHAAAGTRQQLRERETG